MCSKQTDATNPDLHPKRQNDKKENEVQPFVSDQLNQNKQHHSAQINNEDKKERSRSLTPSSDEYEDKQSIQDSNQLNSDDNNSNNEQPEYSKNEDLQSTPNQAMPQKEEEEDKKQAADNKYALPETVNVMTPESADRDAMDEYDTAMEQQLRLKYGDKLAQYPSVERMNFIFRYTVGYKHIKKKKRMSVVCTDIDYFWEMHEKYKLETIISTESTVQEIDAWKQFIYGEDKYGHPVIYDLIGSSDCTKLQKVFVNQHQPFGHSACEHVFRFMRKLGNYKRQNTLKYGKQIHKHVQIMDMGGFTKAHLRGKNRKLTKMVIDALSRIFPEAIYKMYIINAPWPFRALWSTVKGFLDPVTVRKTKVLGEDYLQEMVKEIQIEMIPPSYGGTGIWEFQYGTIPKNYNVDVYHGLD